MHSRHRRVPSALPYSGFEEDVSETSNYLSSTLQNSISKYATPKENIEKNNQKNHIYPNPQFSENHVNVSNYEDSSNDNSIKENTSFIEVCDQIEVVSEENFQNSENVMDDLIDIVQQIMKKRESLGKGVDENRKKMKKDLIERFKNETENFYADRKNDFSKTVGENVEGPAISFIVDDQSIVKFEPSIDKPEKKLPKTVKFKDI